VQVNYVDPIISNNLLDGLLLGRVNLPAPVICQFFITECRDWPQSPGGLRAGASDNDRPVADRSQKQIQAREYLFGTAGGIDAHRR